jgi:DNA-binding NarL/FixJ family response regulator
MNSFPMDSAAPQSFKVGIVDDHPIIRQGLLQTISREPDLQVCTEAAGIVGALEQMAGASPDVLVIDISLDGENGIDLIDYVKSRYPTVKILVYSAHDEETFAGRVLRAGALGFINKREPITKVVEAIRQVLRGEVYLSAQMTKSLLHRAALGRTLDSDPMTTLSDRELEVFQMIGEGLSTVQIANKLQLSPKTIESHRKTIKQKLNLQSSPQLSRRAFQWVMEKR